MGKQGMFKELKTVGKGLGEKSQELWHEMKHLNDSGLYPEGNGKPQKGFEWKMI